MVQILVFGDSVTCGAWDKEGGWVQRLKREMAIRTIKTHQKFYCMIYNLGVDGDTTGDLLDRFDSETKQRLEENEKTIIIFEIGANDSIFDKKNVFWTTKEKFRENLENLVDTARRYSSEIIFNGVTPVDEAMTNPVSWDADVNYKNEFLRQYNGIIKDVCVAKNVHFVDIFGEWTKSKYKHLLEDGVHPNSEGHKRIFNSVKRFLAEGNILQAGKN